MKKLSFFCSVLSVFLFVSGCANSTGDNSVGANSLPASNPEVIKGARLSFLDGNFVAWYVDDDGNLLTNDCFEEGENPITFKWYRKDPVTSSEEEIDNSNKSYYVYDDDLDQNKVILTRITYKGNRSQAESEKILGTITDAVVLLEENRLKGELLKADEIDAYCLCSDGEYFDLDDVDVSIAFVAIIKDEDEEITYAEGFSELPLDMSGDYEFLLKVPGYSSIICKKFIIVKHTFDDSQVPNLSTDTKNITRDCVRFENFDSNLKLEYSIGEGWKTLKSGDEIFVDSDTDEIKVRRAAEGTPNTDGYLKESDEKIVKITEQNIGTSVASIPPVVVPNYDYITISQEDVDIHVVKSGNTVIFKAAINNATSTTVDSYLYSWMVDEKSPSLIPGVNANKDTLSVDSSADVPRGCPIDIEVTVWPDSSENLLYYANIKYTF